MKHNIRRILKTGWINFKRNSYMSFAVTGIMALALFVVLELIMFQTLIGNVISTIQNRVDISAYFNTDAPEDDILAVKSDLEKLPEVSEVIYISRDQALEEFKLRHADEEVIQDSLALLDENPLQATLNIRAINPERYEAISTFLENSSYRNDMSMINYNENKAVIDKINSFAKDLRTRGFTVTIFLVVIAILITFNTIRLTIYNQRQEIEIMRLVGASNWQIQGPYLVEGGVYGVIAAFVALFAFYPLLFFDAPGLAQYSSDMDMFHYFVVNSWQMVLIAMAAGVALGVLSSVVAIRRHLKV